MTDIFRVIHGYTSWGVSLMGLASIFSGQASFAPLANITGLQPTDLEHLATIAWQWMVLSAVVAWIGALIAGYRLLSAFKGQQPAEIAAILHMATQRQRRQNWLWLSIILVGSVALFWLRLPHVLTQQLNQAPNWAALGTFAFSTPEGWLWLARGGLTLLALGLMIGHSITTYRRLHNDDEADLLAPLRRQRRRWRRHGKRSQRDVSASYLSSRNERLERGFQIERRHTRLSLLVVAALLCACLLTLSGSISAELPITALALNGAVLIALGIWLGGVLYLASILAPASHIIESAERTQTFVEAFSASRPTIAPACIALALYSVFSVETRLANFSSLAALLGTSFGWLLMAELALLGSMLLLTLYQARRALPFLVQAAWFAARGTVMSVLGGVDVAHSMQMSQGERQKLATEAERRLTNIAYVQAVLGILVLLCLVLTSFLGGPTIG